MLRQRWLQSVPAGVETGGSVGRNVKRTAVVRAVENADMIFYERYEFILPAACGAAHCQQDP